MSVCVCVCVWGGGGGGGGEEEEEKMKSKATLVQVVNEWHTSTDLLPPTRARLNQRFWPSRATSLSQSLNHTGAFISRPVHDISVTPSFRTSVYHKLTRPVQKDKN